MDRSLNLLFLSKTELTTRGSSVSKSNISIPISELYFLTISPYEVWRVLSKLKRQIQITLKFEALIG